MIDLRPVRRVEANDDLDGFDCGVLALGEWARRFALSVQRASASVTYWFALGIVETLYLGIEKESYGERINI